MRGTAFILLGLSCACAREQSSDLLDGLGGNAGFGGQAGGTAGTGATSSGGAGAGDGGVVIDSGPSDAPFNTDAACAITTEKAVPELLPVDIIWAVDNSTSMQPAIDEVTQGLNNFAALIAGKSLDYRVIMLSLRSKTNPVTVQGSPPFSSPCL